MKRLSRIALAVVLAASALAAGCKEDGGSAPDAPVGGAGGASADAARDPVGAADAAPTVDGSGGADAAPDRAGPGADAREAGPPDMRDAGPPWGIAARPENKTCKPPADLQAPAQKLSQTGCLDPADPRKPAPGLIPYDVASQLWSDGAAKERFVALPDGAGIRVRDCKKDPKVCDPNMGGTPEDDGHWGLPEGTVLVKSFLLGGRYVETRLLVRETEHTWAGYSYEWNDAQTDATVLPAAMNGVTKMVKVGAGMQSWYFPSRSDCFECHTKPAGVSLGLITEQMNKDFLYPSGIRNNQIHTFGAIGLFTTPPPVPWKAVLPDPTVSRGTVTERARSYMHANCAICHRPEGRFSSIDARYFTPLKDMNVCNRDPERGDAGVAGALRLVPGNPARSLMSIRMHRTDKFRMPQLATSVVDTAGVAVVDAWISSLTACP